MGVHEDFEHRIVDRATSYNSWREEAGGFDAWGGVTVADYDGDGRDEYTTGGRTGHGEGFLFCYDYDPDADEWERHELLDGFRPGVGAAAADVDGDGTPELVCGEWGERLLWVEADPTSDDAGTYHVVADGLDHVHDVLAADVDGDGEAELVVREKDHGLSVFSVADDPTDEWERVDVARNLPGDGTWTADLSASDGLDLATNQGWFENAGDASEWERHPLVPADLDWHPETRLVVGDVDGDGEDEVVVTESEEDANARMAVLSQPDGGPAAGPWDAEIALSADLDLRALHSLQLVDLDGDGTLEIFTAEMENGKTDGVHAKPRWWLLSHGEDGWQREVLVDENLGTHCARVGDFDGDGRPDVVGKLWRANDVNGADGDCHVDHLWPR